jgi:hypothetical protein
MVPSFDLFWSVVGALILIVLVVIWTRSYLARRRRRARRKRWESTHLVAEDCQAQNALIKKLQVSGKGQQDTSVTPPPASPPQSTP